MAQRSRPVSAQPVLRTKKSLPSSLRSVVDIVSSQHAFADSPPAKGNLGGYMSSPRSAVTGNPISMTAQKQAEHYLQATTSSSAKNQPSIFEPNLMSSRSEVNAKSTSRSDGSAGDARTSRSDGPVLEGHSGEENRNLRERLDQTVRQLNLLRDRHWSDSQELQKQVAQKTIEINRLETEARRRLGASLNGDDNLELLKEQFKNRQLEAELAAMKENQQSFQQRGSSETTANIQSMVQRFTEKVQSAEEKHAAIQKILDEKNSSIRQLESKLLRRKEGRSGAIERVMLARSKDLCALTLSATFIVWKQGTILQKKENTDGILRFEKQQKEIEAVMQQSQKYRESLEAEKAALVRKYERLAAESKLSEAQMQKDVKDMKQKLEESLKVAELFHQQLVEQKTASDDVQRGLEHQLDDIRIKLSTAEGKKNACQTKLVQIEKDLLDTTSLIDAQIIKIKMLSSENESILAEKHILVEELSCKAQIIFQKDRDAEKLADQEKQLKNSLDDMQLQQSQFILAEKNARRMIEIEIDNCIERICGFGTATGDELVEGALDAAGVGQSLGAIKDHSTMTSIGLMSKLSKMSVRMSCILILWEHHGNKQKCKWFHKWKTFSKYCCHSTHLCSFQNTRSQRTMKMHGFTAWKNCLRVSKRLYFMQKNKDRKITIVAFTSFTRVLNLLAQAKVTAERLSQFVHCRILRHHFVCWAIVIKRSLILNKQTLNKAGSRKKERFIAHSFTKWHVFTVRGKSVKKLCCSWNLNFKKLVLSSWQCACQDSQKLQTFLNALQGPTCRKKQRNVLLAFSGLVQRKRRQKHHIKLISNASSWQLKKSCVIGWNAICVSKRRLQFIFHEVEVLVCQKIQRNVIAALAAFLSRKRKLSVLNSLSVFLTKQKASSVLQRSFLFWQSCMIPVQTRVKKISQLMRRTSLLHLQKAVRSWAFVVFLTKKIKQFESRRLHIGIKRWRCIVAVKCRLKSQDILIQSILSKGRVLNLSRFVFRLWFEYTNVHLARSKRQLAANQYSNKRNQKWLRNAFATWIRVKTTGFGVKRIISERLRKLFFRWHTFVEYRRSKCLLKCKLQQQSSPTGNAR